MRASRSRTRFLQESRTRTTFHLRVSKAARFESFVARFGQLVARFEPLISHNEGLGFGALGPFY